MENVARSCSAVHAVLWMVLVVFSWVVLSTTERADGVEPDSVVNGVFARIRQHDFHPLNREGTFTSDRALQKHGVANLDDDDWKVRLLAIRDLVRALPDAVDDAATGLTDDDLHVRQIAAAALGIARETSATEKLERVLKQDASPLVRCQAAMSLGQMESEQSLDLLRRSQQQDPSRDVRHQCELAVDQIEKKKGATPAQLEAFRSLDESTFESVSVGAAAPDFVLRDTEENPWRLSEANQDRWVVLIWIFADWCPVCHGEFGDLIAMRKEFEAANVELVTIECHDAYRGRVMIAKELDPAYWFSKRSFQYLYATGIWWSHLLDRAGAVGAKYGIDPMCFAVHGEYINRPSTIIIDPEGIVRFAYYGTYWGDRPTIHQTLEMIKQRDFKFEHPERRRIEDAP